MEAEKGNEAGLLSNNGFRIPEVNNSARYFPDDLIGIAVPVAGDFYL